MLQFEELRLRLSAREDEVQEYRQAIGYEGLQRKLAELEEKTTVPGFWNDVEKSQKNQLETAKVKAKLASYDDLSALYEDTLTLIELGNEEEDESVYPEALSDVERFEKMLETQKLTTLLTGQYDANNAIVTFHAGAGGTEAQDWAQMLYRMYTRWAERHGFTYKILDYLDGDEAGLKSASIMIEGENAYGFLRSESGVHRLVRISPFDSSGRRHTSFSSVEVLPELSEDTTVEIRPEDIKMDVFRSSGAGGQHINKTSSAVRLTHLPTGIVVACQNERSQLQNRAMCMKMLTAKLIEIKEREHLANIQEIKGEQAQIAWGSQIRSYVFMPYTLAKDTRTKFENSNINAVMDGDLDGFINAYLKAASLGTLGQPADD
ncbi:MULTISPECIES: peptide chain release factor 2 [unclassified Anaerotruncus]|jgi:peptide chain release factor 2|uniref:peptide chain release factor 2 n=1 Tax=unclassified Anaerotruncus TaxID=2641626 RepID=UPI000337A1FE|nr:MULTISPECIES: peptide chain release factor 2 [unclassified Anaerotruncus]MCI9159797.1 peptide chain release factor 2 [Anaerotruncus sp.]NCE74491.1 peptide chain release factor 2 [Anaerotruncus sp. X29]RKJ74948.1 peptide chain release factor 2 [Anaerotruncus sp. 1XD22-93]EOS63344.1 peptide chain release factor 2 [Anaerotruncus sp. G3(2012)]MCI9234443.1 peptide chain release factor 2 [Anaerotruncus sp.]